MKMTLQNDRVGFYRTMDNWYGGYGKDNLSICNHFMVCVMGIPYGTDSIEVSVRLFPPKKKGWKKVVVKQERYTSAGKDVKDFVRVNGKVMDYGFHGRLIECLRGNNLLGKTFYIKVDVLS